MTRSQLAKAFLLLSACVLFANVQLGQAQDPPPYVIQSPNGPYCVSVVKTPGRWCSGSDSGLPSKICVMTIPDTPITSFDLTFDMDPCFGEGFVSMIDHCPQVLNLVDGTRPLDNETFCTQCYKDAGYLPCQDDSDCDGISPESPTECLCECQECGRFGDTCTAPFVDPSNDSSCSAPFSLCNIPAPVSPGAHPHPPPHKTPPHPRPPHPPHKHHNA